MFIFTPPLEIVMITPNFKGRGEGGQLSTLTWPSRAPGQFF